MSSALRVDPDTGHDADLQMVWDDQWTVITLSNYDAPAGMMLEMPILELVTKSSKHDETATR